MNPDPAIQLARALEQYVVSLIYMSDIFLLIHFSETNIPYLVCGLASTCDSPHPCMFAIAVCELLEFCICTPLTLLQDVILLWEALIKS